MCNIMENKYSITYHILCRIEKLKSAKHTGLINCENTYLHIINNRVVSNNFVAPGLASHVPETLKK